MHFAFKLDEQQRDHLLIRHLKRSSNNPKVLKRIVGTYYALDKQFVTDQLIASTLGDLVDRYNLMRNSWKDFICELNLSEDRFLYRKARTLHEALIEEFSRLIRFIAVDDLGFYVAPAYFRNYQKRREAIDEMGRNAQPPLDCSNDELVAYIKSMKDGDRVIELGISCQQGHKGTIYHGEDGATCIRWDKNHDGSQMGTSFTGGARLL